MMCRAGQVAALEHAIDVPAAGDHRHQAEDRLEQAVGAR